LKSCNLWTMRILHISSAVDFGGGEKHIVDLGRALTTRGHVVYLALRPTNKWQARVDYIKPEKILHVSMRNSFGVFSAKRIADFVKENEIDIVHAHVARDYIPASIACIAAKRAKFVITRHVMFPLKPFNRFALKNLSRAIGVSPAVGNALKQVFPPEKIRVIPNGIDFDGSDEDQCLKRRREFREFHSIPLEALLVGSVGQLIPLKGQRDLVLAAAEVVKHVPNARFVIVGKDYTVDKKFRQELRRLAKVSGLDEHILWLDWTDDLQTLLAAIDLYISPSHSESFGLATLEAMAAGLPVVATETDGSLELLQRKETLVPVGEPVRLAERMSELLKDAASRRSLGDELRQRANDNYSVENMVDRLESLYQEILQAE
jgi:glycosyltransferase involved in cell wall biosynthesis